MNARERAAKALDLTDDAFARYIVGKVAAAIAAAVEDAVKAKRLFPIQSQRGAAPHPLQIPWEVAELAYSVYSARYGRSQSLERLAERGGFGPGEMDDFLPDWRDRCSKMDDAERRLAFALQHLGNVMVTVDGQTKTLREWTA